MILEYRRALRAAVKPELEMMPNVRVKGEGTLMSHGKWVGAEARLEDHASHCHYLPVSLMSWPWRVHCSSISDFSSVNCVASSFPQHLDPFCGRSYKFHPWFAIDEFSDPWKKEHKTRGWVPWWPLPSVWDFVYHCLRNHVNFVKCMLL